MDNWKRLFNPRIFNRGQSYYLAGAVKNVQKTEDGFYAVVAGSEDYEVKIEVEDGNISDMWCSCPYAEDGDYCKHMAAVLFECEEMTDVNDKFDKTRPDQSAASKQELAEVIGRIGESELRSMIMQLSEENDILRNRIMTKYTTSVSDTQMRQLKKQIAGIITRHSDQNGYVNWYNASDFVDAMSAFLSEYVQGIIDKGCSMQAFELTNEVFVLIGNLDIDDSDGGLTDLADLCYGLWEQILEQCNHSEQLEMFEWFKKHYADGICIDFLMNAFHDREILEQILRIVDGFIAILTAEEESGSSWNDHYELEHYILNRVRIMTDLGYPKAETKEYTEQYRRLPAVRMLEVEEYLKNGRRNEAIAVLKESKEWDQKYPGLVAEYSARLIELYRKEKQEKEYKDELIFQVFSYRQDHLDYIKLLKSVCDSSEWEAYREKLLSDRNGYYIKYPLLEAEGMFERMLKEIIAEDRIFQLNEYEKVLKQRFPDQVRDVYADYIKRQAEAVCERKQYRDLISYLKKIKTYPDGKEIAADIAAEWYRRYRRRPAMMDELTKAGFQKND